MTTDALNTDHPLRHSALLERTFTRITDAPLRRGNHVTLLRNGPEVYAEWLAELARATRWIHLDNYIFEDDTIGGQVADVLMERARAGVDVRVLHDWWGSMHTPRAFWHRLQHGGVDVRVVNPPRLALPRSVFHRDHRKVLLIDGTYASLGGVCIADQWLETSPRTGLPYRDTAVSVRGPAVADVERAYARVWDLFGDPLPADQRPAVESIAAAGNHAVRIVIQEPGRMRIVRLLEFMTAGAQQRFWTADAYFLSIPVLIQALLAAATSGVDVRILLPATNDLPVVGALSRVGYATLLEAGIRVYEYSGLMMHAKTNVADGWWSRVGSTNMNLTGQVTNWEIDMVVEDERFGAQMEAMFRDDLDHAREIVRRGATGAAPRESSEVITDVERDDQRTSPEAASRGLAHVSRIGAIALQGADPGLGQNARRLSVGMYGGMLALALLGARFPRLLAWPLAALGAYLGGAGLLRVVRRRPEQEPQPSGAERT